jgi:hypothetical protein
VRARRRGDKLSLVPLDDATRQRAEALAASFLAIATGHIGRSREELDEASAAVRGDARDRKLADGLWKLVEDRCELEPACPLAPDELRRAVFARSSAAWRALGPGESFDRQAVLTDVAAAHGLLVEEIERGLYADLRAAHVLRAVTPTRPRHLVEDYELAQAQAVLLRAVRVGVDVECAAQGSYRALFRRLKFQRLLYTIAPRPEGGYHLEIDGPFGLFEQSTKYGLQLALALPLIRACDRWRLVADVRWGAERKPLRFELEGDASDLEGVETPLPDDVAALLRGLAGLDTPWRASPSTAVLDLAGVGCCVPDLELEHATTGQRVHVEVLGYWSREAVWRRVELVQRGLGERIVFAVGQHLRVSEAVLDETLPGALYVYKRTMSPRALLEKIEAVAG